MAKIPLLTWEQYTLQLRNPFRLSYGVSDTRQAFVVRLAGEAGWGEGTIPPYYGVDPQAMTEFWQSAAASPRPLPESLDEVEAWVGADGPAAARCALEMALTDRLARLAGQPLWQYLGLPNPLSRATSFTIAIDTPQAMAGMAGELAHLPVIKVKLGGDDQDMDRLAAIRAARPDAALRIDANAGWTFEEARAYLPQMEALGLELIEQPMSKGEMEAMGRLQAHTTIPIVADESVQSIVDVDRLANAGVDGVNVKLMKVGGLGPALRLIHRARARGMRIMLGCMVETSVGTTAMAHLMGLANWVDLDAPMLIANDPFQGVTYGTGALVQVPDSPGIGISRAAPRKRDSEGT